MASPRSKTWPRPTCSKSRQYLELRGFDGSIFPTPSFVQDQIGTLRFVSLILHLWMRLPRSKVAAWIIRTRSTRGAESETLFARSHQEVGALGDHVEGLPALHRTSYWFYLRPFGHCCSEPTRADAMTSSPRAH